jgi:hypothetical protein
MHSVTISFPVHVLPFWFLVISLFLPRISLLVMWLQHQFTVVGLIPLLAAIIVPRVLILVLIYTDQGISGWFLLHAIVMVMALAGGGHQVRRRRSSDF